MRGNLLVGNQIKTFLGICAYLRIAVAVLKFFNLFLFYFKSQIIQIPKMFLHGDYQQSYSPNLKVVIVLFTDVLKYPLLGSSSPGNQNNTNCAAISMKNTPATLTKGGPLALTSFILRLDVVLQQGGGGHDRLQLLLLPIS